MKVKVLHLINKASSLAIALNTTTDLAVFVNFSGHVNLFTVRICKSKEGFNEEIYTAAIYVEGHLSDNSETHLKELIKTLEEYMEE